LPLARRHLCVSAKRQSDEGRRKRSSGTESLRTLCWREVDSNLQYRVVKGRIWPERKRFQPVTVENVWPRKSPFSGSGDRDQRSEPQRSATASSCNVAMEVGSAGLGGCEFNPGVALSRRLPTVCPGYRDHAYTSRRRHRSAFLLLRLEPLHRARLGHNLKKPRRGVLLFLSSSCFPLRTDWVRCRAFTIPSQAPDGN
jgi:hypothetical protein